MNGVFNTLDIPKKLYLYNIKLTGNFVEPCISIKTKKCHINIEKYYEKLSENINKNLIKFPLRNLNFE